MSRASLRLSLLLWLVFSASGCLRYEMRAKVQPGGLTHADITFNAPDWVYNAMGAGPPLKMPTSQDEWEKMLEESAMLRQLVSNPILRIRTGEDDGQWLLSTRSVNHLSTPFIEYAYEETGDTWTFVATVKVDPSMAATMQQQIEARLGFIPGLSKERKHRMALGVLRRAEIDILFDFPSDVVSSNASDADGTMANWRISLAQWVEEDDPSTTMFARGRIDSDLETRRTWLALLPTPEND